MRKLLDQVVANAKNNFQLTEETLVISKVQVNEGPKLKRWRTRARGRSTEIQKKSSHITLVLSGEKKKRAERKVSEVKPEEKAKPEEKVEKKPRSGPKTTKLEKEKKMPSKAEERGLKRIFKRKAF